MKTATLPPKNRRLVSARPHAPIALDRSLTTPKPISLKRILVPIDFSSPSLEALRYAKRLAGQSGASIDLLFVAEHVIYMGDSVAFPNPPMLEEMKGKLTGLARDEVDELVPIYPHVLTGKPFAEIVKLAHDRASDLIVIGTHGRTGLRHVLIGSTAEQVVRRAPCPVLVVRRPVR